MVKLGQRKFLLREGYSNERLDRMTPGTARCIIGSIEKKNQAKREAAKKEALKISNVIILNDVVILSRDEYERLVTR